MGFLRFGKLGLLPSQAALCLGKGHAFSGVDFDEVCSELRNHCEEVEQESADEIGGVLDGAAPAQLDLGVSEVIGNVVGVPHGSGETVEFVDSRGVAGPAGR